MTLRFELVDAEGIRPWGPQLAELERAITYPIADGADRFHIDHGEDYGAFFTALGDPRFLVVLDDDRVLGIVAGCIREALRADGRPVKVVYVGDLKLHPDARGREVAYRLARSGIWQLFVNPDVRGWRFAFGAAMRGDRGDVTRTFTQRWHPGRLSRRLGVLALYFVEPERLLALQGDGPGPPGEPGLDLSGPNAEPPVLRNTGKKDFQLRSTGEPWPLAHLPRSPAAWGAGLGASLRADAAALAPGELGCFGLDERLEDGIAWLAAQGVEPGARCTVYALAHPACGWRHWRGASWIHLPTSEI